MLRNRTYLGEIVHKGQSHRGEHLPIIDQPLWDAVRAQLASNTAERNAGLRTRQPSLLTGLMFDCSGNPMTPIHAVKNGTRYRYYVSRPLITKDQIDASAGIRIPATEIEQLVTNRVRQWLLDPGSIYQATQRTDLSVPRRLVVRAAEIGKSWPKLPATRQRGLLTDLIASTSGATRSISNPDDTPRRAARGCSCAIAERRRRNANPVRTGAAPPLRARDQDADRG